MDRDTYVRFYNRINRTVYQKALKLCDKGCVILTAVAYLLLLLYYFCQHNSRLLPTIVIPAVSFVMLSAGRAAINSPRPYEVWGVPPLISKDTVGKSFPSRHVFSIFLIATLFAAYSPAMGLAYYGLAIELAVLRVITGAHFTKDAVAGAVAGIAAGLVYCLHVSL